MADDEQVTPTHLSAMMPRWIPRTRDIRGAPIPVPGSVSSAVAQAQAIIQAQQAQQAQAMMQAQQAQQAQAMMQAQQAQAMMQSPAGCLRGTATAAHHSG
jgi:hypothetical protein